MTYIWQYVGSIVVFVTVLWQVVYCLSDLTSSGRTLTSFQNPHQYHGTQIKQNQPFHIGWCVMYRFGLASSSLCLSISAMYRGSLGIDCMDSIPGLIFWTQFTNQKIRILNRCDCSCWVACRACHTPQGRCEVIERPRKDSQCLAVTPKYHGQANLHTCHSLSPKPWPLSYTSGIVKPCLLSYFYF